MHCYAFEMYLKDGSLRRSFRMHCYAFEMYLKDAVPKRRSLKEF